MTMSVAGRARRSRALRSGDRWLVVVSLLVSAACHLPLIPAHLREAPAAGVAFSLLTGACVTFALLLALRDTVVVWAGVAVLAALAITAYVLARTVGLPLLSDDVGNWLEPLSFPALAAELISLVIAAAVLVGHASPRARVPSAPGAPGHVTTD